MVELQKGLPLELVENLIVNLVMELLKLETLGYPSVVHAHLCLEMLQLLERFFYPLKFSVCVVALVDVQMTEFVGIQEQEQQGLVRYEAHNFHDVPMKQLAVVVDPHRRMRIPDLAQNLHVTERLMLEPYCTLAPNLHEVDKWKGTHCSATFLRVKGMQVVGAES